MNRPGPIDLVRHGGGPAAPALDRPDRLGTRLVDLGLVSAPDLIRALEVQRASGGRLGSILIALGLVRRFDLYQVLADLWGYPFVDLIATPPDPSLARRFDPDELLRQRFIPVARDGRRVTVAISNEPSEDLHRRLATAFGEHLDVNVVVTTDWDLDKAIGDIFRAELVTAATMALFNRSPAQSAYQTFRRWQVVAGVGVAAVVLLGLVLATVPTLVVLAALVNLAFAGSIVFKLVTALYGAQVERIEPVTDTELAALDERDLPFYTILVPVFREANIIAKLIDNLRGIDYPANKLEILLLIEEVDQETLTAARASQPPETLTIVQIPDGAPRTKPRACNVGLSFAKGEYLVIYDAEDRPEPDQLKKAVIAFRDGGNDLACVQAALNYFNAHENFLTRMFTLEYSYWFDYMLPGLDRLHLPIPLGGTSNHFRTSVLRELGGWDPFNVTEDADLGIRASAEGYRVGVINSTTYEEANSRYGNWIRQRSRWIKGYMQTTLVYLRDPVGLVRAVGPVQAAAFAALIGGTAATFLCVLPLWAIFLITLAVDLPVTESFPRWVVYLGALNLVVGNALMVYINVLALFKRRQYRLLPFAFANPLYWMLHSIAAYRAFWQLVTNPFYWEKTDHGLTTHADPGAVPDAPDAPEPPQRLAA
jgi:hypothetical protein